MPIKMITGKKKVVPAQIAAKPAKKSPPGKKLAAPFDGKAIAEKAIPLVAPEVKLTANVEPAPPNSGGKAEVTVTLPLVSETPAYLGVTIQGKTQWLAKLSLTRFSITAAGSEVRVTMTRQQANRRKLIQQAA